MHGLENYTKHSPSPNPLASRKKLHHFSHLSTDSVTSADDDDLTDYHGHRRGDSGSESLYSELTESTEPHYKRNSSPGPAMSVHSPSRSLSSISLQYHNLINSYEHDDFARDLQFEAGEAPEDEDTQVQPTYPAEDRLELLHDSFDQLSQSEATRTFSFDFDREQFDDPNSILERIISDDEKRQKLSKMFSRAASNGDMNRVADMLDHCREWIDIEAQDEDGTSPLIYAACFGHVEIAFMLLEAGAVVDARDKFGWTALVWATNNKHDSMVRLLLEHGASTSAQTAKGHTIVDFLRHDPNDNTKIVQIFQEPSRRESTSSSGSVGLHGDDLFYQTGIDGFEEMMAENERRYRMAVDSANAFNFDMEDGPEDESPLDDEGEFDWERCLLDQMFVFSSKDVAHIVHTTVTRMEPLRSRAYKPVPAYVLFLAARFASNFSSPELVDELLEASLAAVDGVVRKRPEDMALISFWISNCSALLHFLRKDGGLKLTSGLHQAKLEALIQDMVRMLVLDAERRIEKVLEPAMLDHDTIAGLDEVKFQSEWAFLWRGNKSGSTRSSKRASSPASTAPSTPAPRPLKRSGSHSSILSKMGRSASPRQRQVSPRTITTMLSSLLFVMQSYDIHPEMIQYVISQLFHYISGEVFNRMIVNKKLLSRSKALQTRLNLSVLEDWVRLNHLPSDLVNVFGPLVQLLQLLQVLSLQDDLPTWIETMNKLELLNPFQVKRVVNTYRFEVSEQHLPGEISQYVLQVAADTEKMVQRQMMERKRDRPVTMFQQSSLGIYSSSSASSSSSSLASERRGSAGMIGRLDSFFALDNEQPFHVPKGPRSRASMGTIGPVTMMTEAQREKARKRKQELEEEAALMSETRDTKGWLPFQTPSNLAAREKEAERVFVPLIPEEMMALLDTL
ncbi:hypothetical protein BGZ74_010536 [Mortierella antarctica]|nr:hypothetical protein BGZ74_010536 [Mortierella antarctica]